MFKHHAGDDLLDQLRFMADEGFTAMEDNGMAGRPVELQERIANEMVRLGLEMGVFVAHAEFGSVTFASDDPAIRERLSAKGSLFQIDLEGRKVSVEQPPSSSATISLLGPIPLPLQLCDSRVDVQWYACVRNAELSKIEALADDLRVQNGQQSFAALASSMAVNSVLVVGDPTTWTNPMVRVHSSCMTGDVFGSQRCDCGPQLQEALKMVNEAGKGVVIYMNQEGRGIGLLNKLQAYKLQEEGRDTVEANIELGFKMDHRDYGVGAQILREMGVCKIKLISNNPKKRAGLMGYGLEIVDTVPIEITPNKHNMNYLLTKRDKMGHDILKKG